MCVHVCAWVFQIRDASPGSLLCRNTCAEQHLQARQTVITPPGSRVMARISPAPDVCAQTEKKSGLRIS